MERNNGGALEGRRSRNIQITKSASLTRYFNAEVCCVCPLSVKLHPELIGPVLSRWKGGVETAIQEPAKVDLLINLSDPGTPMRGRYIYPPVRIIICFILANIRVMDKDTELTFRN